MKTRVFTICIAIGFVGAVFFGCHKKDMPEKDTIGIIVLKFKQPEYKDYVLGVAKEKSNYIEALAINRCEEIPALSEHYPYWCLSDDWLLIDWRWYDLPHGMNSNMSIYTILTEQKWDKLSLMFGSQSESQTWPLTEPHVLDSIEAIYYIKADNLNKYSNASYDSEMIQLIEATDRWALSEQLDLCEKVETMDSIWTVLQRDLSVAIENGDLEHINDDKYNPYK